jgi:hypothetical protein
VRQSETEYWAADEVVGLSSLNLTITYDSKILSSSCLSIFAVLFYYCHPLIKIQPSLKLTVLLSEDHLASLSSKLLFVSNLTGCLKIVADQLQRPVMLMRCARVRRIHSFMDSLVTMINKLRSIRMAFCLVLADRIGEILCLVH